MTGRPPPGTRVLIVEDEALIALTAEDMLLDLGCEPVATATTLADATAAVGGGGFDIVLLDINLNGIESYPVANQLRAAGQPFIFTTGYGTAAGARYPDVPLVTKPYRTEQLGDAIARALGR